MFKVIKDRKFTHTVDVMVPVDGGYELQSFGCQFRVVPADQAEEHNVATREGTAGLLKLAIVGFSDDLVDENEKPIPFNDAMRDALINDHPIRQGLITAYLEAITKARSGN